MRCVRRLISAAPCLPAPAPASPPEEPQTVSAMVTNAEDTAFGAPADPGYDEELPDDFQDAGQPVAEGNDVPFSRSSLRHRDGERLVAMLGLLEHDRVRVTGTVVGLVTPAQAHP